MNKIKVLIADDHTVVRTGLTALFNSKPDIVVLGAAADGAEAVKMSRQLKPDIVIMDLIMPVMDGVAATKLIREQTPEVKVLVLTTSTVSDDLHRVLAYGAAGIVTKSTPNEDLIDAIHAVAAGRQYIPSEIKKLIAQDPPAAELTDRQLAILEAMARGFTNAEIAKQLDIAEITVRKHLVVVFDKIGAGSRTEAVAIALRKQLVKI